MHFRSINQSSETQHWQARAYLDTVRVLVLLAGFGSVQLEIELLLYLSVQLSMQVAVYAKDAFDKVLAQRGISEANKN